MDDHHLGWVRLSLSIALLGCPARRPPGPPPPAARVEVLDSTIVFDASRDEDSDAAAAESDLGGLDVVQAPAPAGPSSFDRPMAEVWPAVNTWSDALEREYEGFVAALGRAVAARRCRRLDQCLADPSINTLFDAPTDRRLNLSVDCADLPYVLRAYFAFKRRLPMGFVSALRGVGDDPRYMTRMRPTAWRDWTQYRTPRALFRGMTDAVHSGMYRFAPEVEASDFYPVAMRRDALRPGAVYYDPNGHVLAVTEVRDDGTVFLIDGHPDGSLTFKRFGEAFAIGTRRLGGGFKRFRGTAWDGRALARTPNAALPLFDGVSQWSEGVWLGASGEADAGPRARVSYHAWVRETLAAAGTVRDPVRDLGESLEAFCRDLSDRADAVTLALDAGLAQQPHPHTLPWNIYGTSGDWETWSTPSRDARLKAALRELTALITESLREAPPGRREALTEVYLATTRSPACTVTYRGSDGQPVSLTFDTLVDRLWGLSFDPYHCAELRWGAPPGSPERQRCGDGPEKLRWYLAEQPLRNQIDRFYGVATPLDMGPREPPDIDPRRALGLATR